MRKLGFSNLARENLTEMLRYGTHNWGEDSAYAFLDRFIQDLDILCLSPEIGRIEGENYVWPCKQYSVKYQFDASNVSILEIIPKGRPLG